MIPAVAELETLLTDQPKVPLRPNQVMEYEDELRRQQQMVQAPAYVTGHSRGGAQQRVRQIQRALDEGAPKPIPDPGRANRVKRLADAIVSEVIAPALLTRAQMRRNPATAVDHYRRTEATKPWKHAVFQWRRAMRALDPTNDGIDFTNYEQFRQEGEGPGGAATFMVGAQIPGHLAMTPQAKANWPLGEPTADTALKQVKRAERAAAMGAPPSSRAEQPKKPRTAAQQAATARFRQARLDSLAKKRAVHPAPADADLQGNGIRRDEG